jgi:hypothetical protein
MSERQRVGAVSRFRKSLQSRAFVFAVMAIGDYDAWREYLAGGIFVCTLILVDGLLSGQE